LIRFLRNGSFAISHIALASGIIASSARCALHCQKARVYLFQYRTGFVMLWSENLKVLSNILSLQSEIVQKPGSVQYD
jgi:hypothetical protein